jgi:kinetochore protein NDC80
MRQSLAPVSSNAMNSRASLAPGRASMAPGKIGGGGKRQSSFGGRQSMAPGRRSTLAAGGPTKQMEDPRNVREKGFVRQSLQRLIEFLVENNYDRQISPKQLEAPTTKDFLHILTFLYNQIDPRFVLGANVAEEVPAMFKRLRYPFNISKSHLQAVGSPHAWPSLLAALVWLTELLQVSHRIQTRMHTHSPKRSSLWTSPPLLARRRLFLFPPL